MSANHDRCRNKIPRWEVDRLCNERGEAMMRGFDYTPPFPSQVRLLELAAILAQQRRSPACALPLQKFMMEDWP